MQQRSPAPAAPAQARQPHTLIVENRGSISATGVTRIVSCDENGAVLETSQGVLTIGGQEIRVSELSAQTIDIRIVGRIDYLQYTEPRPTAGGWLRRLVR